MKSYNPFLIIFSAPYRAALLALTALAASTPVTAEISFEEVTDKAGPFHNGESWGASWGDYNGDGRPDLYVSNHRTLSTVYRNNGDGTFRDSTLQVDHSGTWLSHPFYDTHGGGWSDFDNDGDQDLLVLTGVCCDAQLFVNKGGVLFNETPARGIPNDREGRQPVWWDYDNDGQLDIALMIRNTNTILRQDQGNFIDATRDTGANCFRNNYGQLFDMDDDGKLDFVCIRDGDFPDTAYNAATVPFQDITSLFPTEIGLGLDTAIADLDGNLKSDIILVRGNLRPNQALKVNDFHAEAWVRTGASSNQLERGFTLQSSGQIDVTVNSRQFGAPNRIFVGAGGKNPSERRNNPRSYTFSLDPEDPEVLGIAPHDPQQDKGLYVSFDSGSQEWKFTVSPGTKSVRGYISIDAAAEVSNVNFFGKTRGDTPIPPKYFTNTGTGFVDSSKLSGLNNPISCASVAAGDFDNDMDVDLYFVCRSGVENLPNILYDNRSDLLLENRGVPTFFKRVPQAGGAEGLVGIGQDSATGIGEAVVVADYDVDGFLDLFVTNGLLTQPLRLGAPDQLFHNTGKWNRWIELDLEGVQSNRDGIGAKVYATSGGVTQLRERDGGYHRWSQNHHRLHFGLARNTHTNLKVEWPSGIVDEFTDVEANKLYRIVEGSNISEVIPTEVEDPPLEPGDACGPPPQYDSRRHKAIFLWKDCGTDDWHMRVTAGGSEKVVVYRGEITSSEPFSKVVPVSMEGHDIVDSTDPNKITYKLGVTGGGEDGIDFSFPCDTAARFLVNRPRNALLLVGAGAKPAPLDLDLITFSDCTYFSIDDVEVDESERTANFTVNLGTSNDDETVQVDYTTTDFTAKAGEDYTTTSGTLIFQPGEISRSIEVPILQDTAEEGPETFTVTLSNAVNAPLVDAEGTGVINDDDLSACGEPTYDPNAEVGHFLWQDCSTGVWHIRTTGGDSLDELLYEGELISSRPFTSVAGVDLEDEDTLNTDNPLIIGYLTNLLDGGEDGVDFRFPAEANVCLEVKNSPVGDTLLVGANRIPLTAPLDLSTLSDCKDTTDTLTLNIDNEEILESEGIASFSITLSAPSHQLIEVDVVTEDDTAIAGEDYTAVTQTLIFNPGETSKIVEVPITLDTKPESTETFNVVLSNPVNTTLENNKGIGTIIDNSPSACGRPDYNPATEQGQFLWRDCSTNEWRLRTTGGGGTTTVSYEGRLTSNQSFTRVAGLESSDVIDTTNPLMVDYLFKQQGAEQDGMDFAFPEGSQVCLEVIDSPGGATVLVGTDRTPYNAPFDLETLGACQ